MKNLRFVKKVISLCHHKVKPLPIPINIDKHFRDPLPLCDHVICESSLSCFVIT